MHIVDRKTILCLLLASLILLALMLRISFQVQPFL